MIVSTTETYCAWSTEQVVTYCSDLSDGMANMNTIKYVRDWESKYPAFKWCNDFNTRGISGWYLPAKNELNDIYTNKNAVNTTFAQYACVQLTDWYWSSYEYSNNYAWVLHFYGYHDYNWKDVSHRVRAVQSF